MNMAPGEAGHIERAYASRSDVVEPFERSPAFALWRWLGMGVVSVLGLGIGAVVGLIVGILSGLIQFSC